MCCKARGCRAVLRFRAPNTALGKPCSAAIMREASAEVVTKAFFQPSEFISLSALGEGEGSPYGPFAAFSWPIRKMHAVMAMVVAWQSEGLCL